MFSPAFYLLALALLVASPASGDSFDPTRPPDRVLKASSVAKPELESNANVLELRSILISDERRVAVINERHVVKGDRIGDAEVISIQPNAVQLRAPSGPITLELYARVKRQSAAVGD